MRIFAIRSVPRRRAVHKWMPLVIYACAISMAPLAYRGPAQSALGAGFADQAARDQTQSKFLRYVPDDNGGATLQASVVRYENADGVTVDLVAAVHIADHRFFKSLDDSFADYDAVLYELVAPREMLTESPDGSSLRTIRRQDDDEPAPPRHPTSRQANQSSRESRERKSGGGGSMSWVSGLQKGLKNTLKLTFQLDEINYHRANFVHADLDYETFSKMQEDRGESFFSLMINSMLQQMQNPDAGANQPGLGDLLFALRSPDKARQLKLLFGRQFGEIDEQMAGMEGPNGSVLLTERNKAALATLTKAIAAGHKHMAIFYGAAHLKKMDKTLTEEMGFHQVGPPFWRVAWDMTSLPAPATQPATMPSQR